MICKKQRSARDLGWKRGPDGLKDPRQRDPSSQNYWNGINPKPAHTVISKAGGPCQNSAVDQVCPTALYIVGCLSGWEDEDRRVGGVGGWEEGRRVGGSEGRRVGLHFK